MLLGMGGPAKTDDVREFLFNIFSDRNIIRMPGGQLFQRPFAKLISSLRRAGVEDNYRAIGGGSPLLMWTEKQAEQLEQLLSDELPGVSCMVGMRYFHPFIEDSIARALKNGFRRFVFLPMYPQYSKATTGSVFEMVRRAIREHEVEAVFINDFHDDPGYTRLLKEQIDANIAPDETLLFSAHSLPQKFVDEGDPYVQQTEITTAMAAGDRDFHLSYQSRTGPVKWIGPDTVAEVRRLLSDPKRKLFIVPISFVCDHIETLHELDIKLKEDLGIDGTRIRRMPMFNDAVAFTKVVAEIVRRKGRG